VSHVELQRSTAYIRMGRKSNLTKADWVHSASVEQACRDRPCKHDLCLC
jgi:hypothetical protein